METSNPVAEARGKLLYAIQELALNYPRGHSDDTWRMLMALDAYRDALLQAVSSSPVNVEMSPCGHYIRTSLEKISPAVEAAAKAVFDQDPDMVEHMNRIRKLIRAVQAVSSSQSPRYHNNTRLVPGEAGMHYDVVTESGDIIATITLAELKALGR